ncbi:MAG: C10 family peptidase [Verrucomicrobia bacterium]|nr:C10 family peptidase [Verrucomicrobiota bacterium]
MPGTRPAATSVPWNTFTRRPREWGFSQQGAFGTRAFINSLCLQVDIGVGMNYGLALSGSDLFAAERALEDHYRYHPDASVWARSADEMAQELDWLRPLELAGAESLELESGKPAWVVGAYNRRTDPWQFWMNLGWGGWDHGWYSVDQVPHNTTQLQLTRIAPLTVRFVGALLQTGALPVKRAFAGIDRACLSSQPA